jgi:hypothetical protein
MRSDSLVRDDNAFRYFPSIQPVGYAVSVKQALDQLNPASLESIQENEAASFRIRKLGFFIEGRQVQFDASPREVYRVIINLGGIHGWLYMNSLWKIRGYLDRLVGGPGLRGRRMDGELLEGDVVDFYRVETLEVDRMIRLRTELVAPGTGWMEWYIQRQPKGNVRLSQIAYFAPKGIPGFLYWYFLLPFHRLVFKGLLKAIVRWIKFSQ